MQKEIENILKYLWEDITREWLRETPKRVEKAYAKLFEGYNQKPEDIMTVFENESEWDLENLRQELNILWDFNIWDLKISKAELFPEMETEEFNADDYETLTATLIIKVKDDMELEMLKKDLDNLWYTNYK